MGNVAPVRKSISSSARLLLGVVAAAFAGLCFASEARLLPSEASMQCYSKPPPQGSEIGGVLSADDVAKRCADNPCGSAGDAMFERYVLEVTNKSGDWIEVSIPSGKSGSPSETCWLNSKGLAVVGLTETDNGETVVCDPYGGMGAQRCEEAQ